MNHIIDPDVLDSLKQDYAFGLGNDGRFYCVKFGDRLYARMTSAFFNSPERVSYATDILGLTIVEFKNYDLQDRFQRRDAVSKSEFLAMLLRGEI